MPFRTTTISISHDEAIATVALTHALEEMREATEILNFLVVVLEAHAGVPEVRMMAGLLYRKAAL